MRKTSFLLLATFLIASVVLVSLSGTSTANTTPAQPMLPGLQQLDGLKVYFTQAHDEGSVYGRTAEDYLRFAGLLEALGAQVDVIYEWRAGVPADADMLVIGSPDASLGLVQVLRIWEYMQAGGAVLAFADPVTNQDGYANFASIFLDQFAFQLLPDMVGRFASSESPRRPPASTPDEDDAPASGDVATSGSFQFAFTTTWLDADHPITSDLDDPLWFSTARSIELVSPDVLDESIDLTVLAMTSTEFYGERGFADALLTGFAEHNIGTDSAFGSIPLALAYEDANTTMRMVLISDDDFASNGGGMGTSPTNSQSFLYPGNVRFLVNAVAWLTETEAETMSFPTPGPTPTITVTPSPTPTPTPEATATPAPESSGS